MRGRRRLFLTVRLFAVQQRLLPARFRERSREQSVATFEQIARESFDRGGTPLLIRTLVHASADLWQRLPSEYIAARRAGHDNSLQPTHTRALRKRGRLVVSGIGGDMRYALRRVRREPAFMVFAALIMGLGIGANTAVFSVMSPLLIRPLPLRDPDRLVWVANTGTGGLSGVTSRASNLRDYRELNRTFESLTGYFAFFDYGSYTLIGTGEPERLMGAGVARDFLEVLGVQPQVGRNFVQEEGMWGGRRAVILTHEFWVRRFNAHAGIIGQSLALNNTPMEVVGVLPRSFDFASTFTPALRVDFLIPFPISDETDAWGNTLAIIGRLRPGESVATAQADLDRIVAELRREDPNRWGLGARVSGLQGHIAAQHRSAMMLLVAAAAAVMLVACANLSNLLLARGRARRKEMAVRSVLGAGRRQLVSQLSIESLVLAFCGGFIGVALAWVLTRAVTQSSAVSIPLLRMVTVDRTALFFALAITVAAGVLTGLAPILQILTGREADAMRDSSRGSTSGRRSTAIREVLVVSEMAAACVLLVGSGLLMRSFLRVLDVDLGFEPAGALTWRVDANRTFEDTESMAAFYSGIVQQIEQLPGVEGAGFTDSPPLGRNRTWPIAGRGVVYRENQVQFAFPRLVDAGYLQHMRIPLLEGRHFTPFDNHRSARVVILNKTAAETVFPGQDPIGRTAVILERDWEVIGVVADVRHQSIEERSGNEMYLPYTQVGEGTPSFTLVVRSSLPLSTLAPRVRRILSAADPAMATGEFQTMDSIIDHAISPRRFVLSILGGFAATALLLAALGIYAVLSCSVSQRIPEIGIRMALGESAAHVRWHVVRRTLLLAIGGVLLGAALSIVLTRLMQSMLFDVQPEDPLTFIAMAAILVLVAAVAGFLPARRASATDPVTALRT